MRSIMHFSCFCFVVSLFINVQCALNKDPNVSFMMIPGWHTPGNGYQYALTSRKMTYAQAREECKGWGGSLAQHGLRDRFYYKKIADHFPTSSWIGLNKGSEKMFFSWADERPMNFGWHRTSYSLLSNPSNKGECVIMTRRSCGYASALFDAVPCDHLYFGLCEQSVGSPPQYSQMSKDGTTFAFITAETMYPVAKKMCQKWGGKLAEKPITNSKLANDLIKKLYKDRSMWFLNSWVGLSDTSVEGELFLESKMPVNTSDINWSSNFFNSQARDCATLNPRNFGAIQLERCSLKKTILCEKPSKSNEQQKPSACLPQRAECQREGFRTIDGTCHNRLNSDRGREKRAFKRMLPAAYDDGEDSPRGGHKSRLPSARAVTQGIKGATEPKSLSLTHQFPLWGQFLAHDLTKLGELKDTSGALLHACDCGDTKEECFNIPIPEGDAVRSQMQCYSFLRAEKVPDVNCASAVREQENRVTSYIDASNVYGSTPFFLSNLRTGNGLLKIGNFAGTEYYHHRQLPVGDQVPSNLHSQFECEPIHFDFTNVSCFAGGDIRVNEQAALSSGHTMWLRKHNQIATELRQLNPLWGDDKVFWTTRSVIAAIQQQITFNEFLPILLGEKHMRRFGLKLTQEGYYYGFDSLYDATIDISFATAALRLGHTLINGILTRPKPDFSKDPKKPPIDLRNQFFDPTPLLEKGGPGAVLRGMVTDPAMVYDSTFTEALTNHLFAKAGHFGRDLPAINIQRGRDHGIPSYMEHRRLCGLSTTEQFEMLEDMPLENRMKLKRLYNRTEDIDLFAGGISELPQDNSSGIPGPTFACLIAYQMRDLRRGDAFWFENGGAEAKFTFNQLQSIKKVRLSRIICDVGENVTSIQPMVMLQHTLEGNNRVSCGSLPRLDLRPFQEKEYGFGDALKNGRNNEEDNEWSVWFPYSITSQKKIPLKPAPVLLRHLKIYRAHDVCDDVLDTDLRTVNGFYQIRYKCPPGAIKATDFPPVDSKEVYWTQWSNQNSPANPFYDDYELKSGSGACLFPVAIQAQTTEGTPARETGDVFEEFSSFQGLICKGIHQTSRRCHDYKVRYLCLRD